MCPDRSLLSALYDKEVEEPWKSDLEAHLKECVRCRREMEALDHLSCFLGQDEIGEPGEKTLDNLKRQVCRQARRDRMLPLWERRRFLPAAAAAAILLFSFSLIRPFDSKSEGPLLVRQAVKADFSTMDDLIPIALPPDQKFSYYGDSQLMKAAGLEGGLP